MTISILLIIVGFVLLIKGADWLVSGASSLARKYNISDLTIGLTIVAFGTSAPELVVNSVASFQNYSDIILGNVIGSNIFNLFAILGIVGIISPIVVQSGMVWKEIPMSFAAALLLLLLSSGFFLTTDNLLSRIDGLILLVLFLAFLYYVYKNMSAEDVQLEKETETVSNGKIWLLIIVGLAGLVLGGKLVVDYAVKIATILGVSEKIIGLTIVAAGTSLPELVTSVVAALKKNSDIAIGNIIGSNIFNILLIISVSTFINPVVYNPVFNTDIYLLLGGTAFLFAAMFISGKRKLDRWEAALMLIVFIGYISFQVSKELV